VQRADQAPTGAARPLAWRDHGDWSRIEAQLLRACPPLKAAVAGDELQPPRAQGV